MATTNRSKYLRHYKYSQTWFSKYILTQQQHVHKTKTTKNQTTTNRKQTEQQTENRRKTYKNQQQMVK